MAKFKKGQSGNPKGRAPGSGEAAKLRADLLEHVPTAIEALVAKIKDGDVSAIRVLLDRVLPPLKAVDRPVPLLLPNGLAAQGRTVMEALGRGEITPDEAANIMQSVLAQTRIVEVDELERRIAALEGNHGKA